MNGYVVGIDIGSSKICAAVGKLDKQNKMQLVGITSSNCSGLKKAVVVDIDSTSEAIKTCIGQLERMVDIEITDAYVSLPAGVSELINSKGIVAVSSEDREITENDVERVLETSKLIEISSDKEIIGVVPQQFIVDDYDGIKDPVGMTGSRLEVDAQVVLAQTIVVSNLLKSVRRSGVKVSGISLQPIAEAEIVLKKDEKEEGTVLVDVGAETIDISVFKAGNLCYTDIIPLGGNSITNDISVCLKVPFSQAEKLKIKYGVIGDKNNSMEEMIKVTDSYGNVLEVEQLELKEIIEARIEELLLFISEKLKNSEYYNEISGVVIVGGGIALIRGIESYAKSILKKSVRIGAPEYVGASSPIYTNAVGIVQDVINALRTSEDISEFKEVSSKKRKPKEERSKQNEKNGFVVKIKEFLAEFF